MIIKRGSIYMAYSNGVVLKWRQQRKRGSASEDVKDSIVDESWRIWIAVLWIIWVSSGRQWSIRMVWVGRGSKSGSGDLNGEFG